MTMRRASERADEPFDALVGLMGIPDPETLAILEAAGITGIIASPWQMENPDLAPLHKKQNALEKYAAQWMK